MNREPSLPGPEIALLISTYQRPAHLRRALHSIALQQGVEGRFEVVVTDDGSSDETASVVAEFAARVPFSVSFVTHPHQGFQLARCRNQGVQASNAPYLLFLDGDCILPPDHVRHHLAARRRGQVVAGDCYRLSREVSESIDEENIGFAIISSAVPLKERWRLWSRHMEAWFQQLIRHPRKPKLVGNNIALWRQDYRRVNGYDQQFRGWGCEDDDLGLRLRRAGLRIRSIRHKTRTYHLWHPPDQTAPVRWRDGANVGLLLRPFRLSRCMDGLERRSREDLSVRIIGAPLDGEIAIPGRRVRVGEPVEVEVLVLPGQDRFSGKADCNILVLLDRVPRPPLAKAHILVSNQAGQTFPAEYRFGLNQWERVFALVGERQAHG